MNYRIQEITVEGLFGMFDHHIPLNQKERITIVYGVNGIGKTMIMRMVDHLFKGEFGQLRLLPFKLLSIQLSEGCFINVEKVEQKLIVHYKSNKVENKLELGTPQISDKKRAQIFGLLTDRFSNWRVIGTNIYDRENDKTYTLEQFLYYYPHLLPPKMSINIEDDSLEKLILAIDIYFITTQRLSLAKTHLTDALLSGEKKFMNDIETDAVDYFSWKISRLIQEKDKEYGQKSKELESSLGERLLKKQIKTDYTIEALHEEIQHLDKKRAELKRVGLLRENGKLNFNRGADEISRGIMSANIEDMKIKLKVFDNDDVYKKLNLFLEIFNKRLSFKQISISKDGFVFTNNNGEKIESKDLSLGEQHEVILLYQLLFEVPENALVMIDEPEISHHIMWQKSFVEDMLEIIKLRNFDVYVNTHSPSIVNGNWDMTISLREEELVEN